MSVNRPDRERDRRRPGRPEYRPYPYPYQYPYGQPYPYPYGQLPSQCPYGQCPYGQQPQYGQQPYPYTQPQPSTCPTGSVPYNVQSGDTLDNIASRLGVSADAVAAINPDINTSGPLPVGQSICLPTQS
jgi:hypothetical protein